MGGPTPEGELFLLATQAAPQPGLGLAGNLLQQPLTRWGVTWPRVALGGNCSLAAVIVARGTENCPYSVPV